MLKWIYPNLLWRVNTQQNEVYLTFDDGPVPEPTEFVLETLKAFQAKGTFFCIGDNIRKHPDVFDRVLREQHAIGNHTFNHLKGWNTPLEKYLDNTRLCQMEISNLVPSMEMHTPAVRLFRPPYGRITNSQIRALKNDFQIVMWDVLTSDYNQSLSPEKCLQGSVRATRPGSIVVFHDSLKAEKNLSHVLPRYLETMTSRGFVFKTLDHALKPMGHEGIGDAT
ncbi:MAG: polysaccharide deacetylase family protein [Flammeovirgaceae bacterium]